MLRIALVLFVFMVSIPAYAAPTEDVQIRIFNYFLKRANEGDMVSQYIIGSRYETGVGVQPDKVKAYEWFAKSAAQGHPLAMQKMEVHLQAEKKDQLLEARAAKQTPAKTTVSTQAPAPAVVIPPRTPAPVAKAPEPAALVVAKASPEPAVNALDIVLKGAWKRGPSPAEYLPSVKTSCLPAGNDEVVCFSQEMQRTVGNSRLTYTVKATLNNFSKDGSFDINYLYNVTEMDKADKPAPTQDKDGASDLAEKLGWQEPAQHLDCKASGDKALTCIKDKRYSLQYAR